MLTYLKYLSFSNYNLRRFFMKLRLVVLSILVIAFFTGCASFPTQQLSFDVTTEKMPVMLTPIDSNSTMKSFDFAASYMSEKSITNKSTNGGSISNSSYMEQKENYPVAKQLHQNFIQDPNFVVVKSLSVSINQFDFSFGGSYETLKYTTALSVACPIGDKK